MEQSLGRSGPSSTPVAPLDSNHSYEADVTMLDSPAHFGPQFETVVPMWELEFAVNAAHLNIATNLCKCM